METMTKRTICSTLLVLSFGLAGTATLAQDATPGPTTVSAKTNEPRSKAAPAKTHKVWTDDDVSTFRTPADRYAEEKAAKEAAATSATVPATAAAQPAMPNGVKTAPSALSNPKSAEQADNMIAWETRDIDAQVDYLDKIQDQLQIASGAERDHLLSEKARMEGVLAQTQQELKTLRAKKAELEKAKPQNQ
jgi:hypothetical protein